MNKQAKFNIGNIVKHNKLGYRAVIVDIDPIFNASKLPNPQAHTREFSTDHVWYRLAVDETDLLTYVKEDLIVLDSSSHATISNPHIYTYLDNQRDGYCGNYKSH